MADQGFKTFDDFWLFYLAEHSRRETRALHFAGTSLALALVTLHVVLGLPWLIAAAIVGAYALAWLGHFAFERNQPATFRYPLWSLMADFRMFWLWLSGGLGHELRRAGVPA